MWWLFCSSVPDCFQKVGNCSGPTGGISIILAGNNRSLTRIPRTVVPPTDQAIHLFTQNGEHLTRAFLEGIYSKSTPMYRHYVKDVFFFFARCSSMNMIYENMLHNNGNLFKDSIDYFIQLTDNLLAW